MAEPIAFDNPPAAYLSSTPGSAIVKRLAWYGFASYTKKSYNSAIELFESFYVMMKRPAWSTTKFLLEEWVAHWIFGSILPKQGQVKPETVGTYLSALKSYHIDRHLIFAAFDTPRIALIIKDGKRLFPKQKTTRLPITKDILERLTEQSPWTSMSSTSTWHSRWHRQVFYTWVRLHTRARIWRRLHSQELESQDRMYLLRKATSTKCYA